MIKLLELIFQGYIQWLYGITLEVWEFISSQLLELMSMDFAYLESHVAIIPTIRQALLAIGWALLLGNLAFQAGKSMLSGMGFDGEDPKLLFARTFVFAFLLLASPQICDICLNMTARIIELLELPSAVNVVFADESCFNGLTGAWLLVVICGVIVMFKTFRLILEMAERYVILALLTISAPLAFGVGGSRNTSEIFSGWCKMYGSMCLLTALNVVFIKLLLSVLSYVPSGLDVLPWMVLVLTITKVAKKADAIVTRIGLNPAITGDSLGRSFPGMLTYMVARTAISNVSKSIGKGGGNAGTPRGRSGGGPRTSPGGAGNARRPGQPAGARTNAKQSSYSAASASNQTTAQNSTRQSTQQESTARNTATQNGGSGSSFYESSRQNVSQTQTGGFASSESEKSAQGQRTEKARQGEAGRKSAVPPGIHRGPSHVRTQTSPGGNRSPIRGPVAGARSAPRPGLTTVNTGPTRAGGAGAVPFNTSQQREIMQTGPAGNGQTKATRRANEAPRPGRNAVLSPAGAGAHTVTHVNVPAGTMRPVQQSGQAASAKTGTAGSAPINRRSGQASAPHPGLAGNGSERGGGPGQTTARPEAVAGSSRFTGVSAEGKRQSLVNQTVRAKEQSQITVNQGKGGSAGGGSRAKQVPVSAAVGSKPNQQAPTQHGGRMTLRPAQKQQSAASHTQTAKTPAISGNVLQGSRQPAFDGPAGSGQARSSQRPDEAPRSGRNAVPPPTGVWNTGQTSRTARQESRAASASNRPAAANTQNDVHHGPAGTAQSPPTAKTARQSGPARPPKLPAQAVRDSLGNRHNWTGEEKNQTKKDGTRASKRPKKEAPPKEPEPEKAGDDDGG